MPESELQEFVFDEPWHDDMSESKVQRRKAATVKGLGEQFGITDRDIRSAAYDGDRGCADLFIKVAKDKLLFDSEEGVWYVFSPDFGYAPDVNRQCYVELRIVAGIFEDFLARLEKKSDDEEEDPVIGCAEKQIAKINSCKGTKAILEMAASGKNSLAYSGIGWDTAKYVFPFRNCLLDLRTGIPRQYRPTDYIKFKAAVDYDPNADCPIFKAALLDAMNDDQEMCDYLQAAFGYMCCRTTSEEIIMVFYGTGGNFKGVFLESLQAMAGDLMTPMPIEKFLKQMNPTNPDSPSASTLLLRGKMACISSEPDEGKIFGAGKLKEFSGGNYLTGRAPFARVNVRFAPTHTIVIETNYKPHAASDDGGIWRRLRLVEWPVKYVDNPDPNNPMEHKRDGTLKARIKENELPGIANWLIEGAQKWINGSDGTGEHPELVTPQKVLDATAEYRRSEDNIQEFFDDCLAVTSSPSERKNGAADNNHCQPVYNHYRKWATAQGYTSSSILRQKLFGEKMRAKLKIASASDLPRDKGGCYYPNVIIRDVNQFEIPV